MKLEDYDKVRLDPKTDAGEFLCQCLHAINDGSEREYADVALIIRGDEELDPKFFANGVSLDNLRRIYAALEQYGMDIDNEMEASDFALFECGIESAKQFVRAAMMFNASEDL
jgi:hypothetical protein